MYKEKKDIRFSFIYVASVVVVVEMIAGGGGGLINLGGMTFRNIVFFIMAPCSLFLLMRLRGAQLIVYLSLLALYIASCALSIIVMFEANADLVHSSAYYLDIKQLSIVLLFPCICYFSKKLEYKIINFIKICSVVMGLSYLLSLFFVHLNVISFDELYKINDTGEFFFSPYGTYVYKGFIYLAIGAFLFMFHGDVKNNKLRWLGFFISVLALILTRSRGLIISFSLVSLFYFILMQADWRSKVLGVISSGVIICTIVVFFPYIHSERDAISDSVRFSDFIAIIDLLSVHPFNMLSGFGSGFEINGRTQIENAYLNTWLKFGVLGLLMLFIPLILIIKYRAHSEKNDTILVFCVLLMYVQSNFNPYVNNSIGLFFILYVLSLFLLKIKNIGVSIKKSEDKSII
ncbi:O-antigen ligase family protein [Aeromonas caviae]|uniref:O-antigen ligase family protein n=1 Tax=Aeromonas caviae TaxID=648 RepID=A0A7T4C2M8_AERCA|nr:O-antigen ligase family protein [Aeromonas caviae]QQA60734.1 O-antigen ligase family protein [Aeromonas caviae]